jgi:lipopolysaccharide export LptBFGC system permease protein LptF
MRTLDRYIARQFLVNLVTLLVLLMSLTVVIDVLINLNRFVRAGAELAGEKGTLRHAVTTLVWIVDLWGPRLLQLFTYIGGLTMVIAMGFTCAQLVRRRELVAALASGVSLQRLAAPFFVVAMGVTAIQAANQEFLIPHVAHLLTRSPKDALERNLRPFETPLIKDGSDRLWYAQVFDAGTSTLEGLHIWVRDDAGRVVTRIVADRAEWRDGVWVLEGGRAVDASVSSSAAPGLGTPVERVQTSLNPEVLVAKRFEGYGNNLSSRQIGAMFEGAPMDAPTRERFERVRWGRYATLTGNLLALVLVLPFFMVREPRAMMEQTLKAAPIAGIALGASAFAPAFALPGVPPQIGVFAAALVLLPLALAAAVSVRT